MKGASLRRGAEKGKCPFCNKDYHEIYIFLKCKETTSAPTP